MATPKKKTNYIGYDLKWLEDRCNELKKWCEEKLSGGIEDRIEIYESTRGNPIIKVIASEETQIKTLRDTLKELPSMLLEINRLRKLAEEEDSGEATVRGDHDVPGFMEVDEDDTDESIKKVEVIQKRESTKKQSQKAIPTPTPNVMLDDDEDDGDFEDP